MNGKETLNNGNGKIIRMAGNGIKIIPEPARVVESNWVYYPELNNYVYVEGVKPVESPVITNHRTIE